MDTSQYLEIFLDEAKEHLQVLSDQLMILENEPENANTINEIFRAAHSLKGMAGTMGYKRMQLLTHDMENLFSEVRNGKMKVTGSLVDVLFQSLDALDAYVTSIRETADEGTNDNEPITKELNRILDEGMGKIVETPPEQPQVKTASSGVTSEEKKWEQILLEPHEKQAIIEAHAKGMYVYGVDVRVQETCILKAARAFLVFKALEELGEVIVSNPSVQDIEDEKFGFDFSIYFVTTSNLEQVIAVIKNVSEIENAYGAETEVDFDNLKEETQTIDEDEDEDASIEVMHEVAAKPAAIAAVKQTSGNAGKQKPAAAKPVVNRTVRVDIEKLDVLMNLVSELIIAKNSLVSARETDTVNQSFNEQIEYLESVTTSLHESVMKVRMVPIESVVNKFPRMIRDLTKQLGKKMELYMSGEETELDRTVVDEIGDPLMHLLRNSADHGLESNDVRVRNGKPKVGSIYLDAFQDGNNVVIEVRDDGNGIDVKEIKKKAIERGIISIEQADIMTDKEIVDLLFLPSFSTAKEVTDVSGRGVGLDVVKSKIETLGGDVSVKTRLGEGSTFSIRLPLTLAIIQALMVCMDEEKYAIPISTIETIEDITADEIKYVETQEVISLRGIVIPLIRLNKILDTESKRSSEQSMVVVIIKKGENMAGLVVDELIGQQEIVIKSLGKYIKSSKMISGATILGDGEVALIIDANALI